MFCGEAPLVDFDERRKKLTLFVNSATTLCQKIKTTPTMLANAEVTVIT